MVCPKCGEGQIKKIRFLDTGKKAYLCEACEALWFHEKNIPHIKPSTIRLHSKENDLEYSYTIDEEKDQQNTPSFPIQHR